MARVQSALRRRGRPENPGLASRRREEILAAATEIFASRGYGQTDLQVVADRLNVGKGTVYRYFPSKRALFLAAADRGMRGLHAFMEESLAGINEPLARIKAGIGAYLAYFDRHPEVVELIIQERAAFKDRRTPTYFEHRERNIKPWIALIEALIEAGEVRRMPAERIVNVLSRLLYGTMFTRYFTGSSASIAAQTDELLDIVFDGILIRRPASHRARRKAKQTAPP